jgi:hypothetical protein
MKPFGRLSAMEDRAWTGIRGRDVWFMVLLTANVLCLGGFLATELETSQEQAGWRRIDIGAVEAKIRSGDLVRHEALWYHLDEEEP